MFKLGSRGVSGKSSSACGENRDFDSAYLSEIDLTMSIGKTLGAFDITSGSAENTLFRRKLASIHTFFPHDDNPPVNVAQLYNDLFELLRSVYILN